MNFQNKKIQKLTAVLIVFSILIPAFLFFSTPKKVEAQGAGWAQFVKLVLIDINTQKGSVPDRASLGIQIKEQAKLILAEVLKGIARRLLQQMTKSTLNWINSGFHGAPLFVENPKSFFRDIEKYEVRNFVDTIGYDSLRFPFGKTTALNIINTFKRGPTAGLQYTLSSVINDPVYLENYRNNFNVGGWNGFLINTQYPQNNAIGFRLLATEEISKRLNVNDIHTNAGQVQNTLNQGLGFLSPQTCPSNPKYNNLQNQFNQKTFKQQTQWNPPDPTSDQFQNDAEYERALQHYTETYNQTVANERLDWTLSTGCPGGLVNTTPGSAVGAALNKALGGSQDQTTLAAAMGNSVSQIVDSLLNHFLQKGLTALSSTVNPPKPVDDWSYNGQSLGTDIPANSSAWDAGPDELVVVADFKQGVTEGIKNTKEEIALMDQTIKTINLIWPQIRALDQCIPGPDIKWGDRLQNEWERNDQKFQEKASDQNGEKAALARIASQELKYAVDSFQDWIKNKMMLSLPDSVNYIDAVEGALDPLNDESNDVINSKRVRIQSLARLQSIQANLNHFTTDPAPNSGAAQALINIYKQYKAVRPTISSSESIEDTRNTLNLLIEQYNGTKKMTAACKVERTQNGWGPIDTSGKGGARAPGIQSGSPSLPSIFGGRQPGPSSSTEKGYFCDSPIVGGFSHGEATVTSGFIVRNSNDEVLFKQRTTPPVYGNELAMVNASNVPYSWGVWGDKRTDVQINCKILFKASVLDYKGSINGLTTISDNGGGGVGVGSGSGGSCVDTGPATSPKVATPTSAWNPPPQTMVPGSIHPEALVNNGWWPHLSTDGKFVAYGNFGGSWVTNLATKKTYDLTNPPGLPSGGRCYSGFWMEGSSKISEWCEIPGGDFYNRYEWTYNSASDAWISTPTGENTNLVAGNYFGADKGHWFSELAGKRIVLDGKILASKPPSGVTVDPSDPSGSTILGTAISQDGDTIVHACNNSNLQICVWNGSTLANIYDAQTPNYGTTTLDGYILYGFNGPLHGITPDGEDVDLTVAPGGFEQTGRLFKVNGQLWVASGGYENLGTDTEKGYVFLRPWGSYSAIAVAADVGRDQLSVAVSGSNFVIATTEVVNGTLTVVTVPINSPRGVVGNTCVSNTEDSGTGTDSGGDLPENFDTSTSTEEDIGTLPSSSSGGVSAGGSSTQPTTKTPLSNSDSQISYNKYSSTSSITSSGASRIFSSQPSGGSSGSSYSSNSGSNTNSGGSTSDNGGGSTGGNSYDDSGSRSFTVTPAPSNNGAQEPLYTNQAGENTPKVPAAAGGSSKWWIIIGVIFLVAIAVFVWWRMRNRNH